MNIYVNLGARAGARTGARAEPRRWNARRTGMRSWAAAAIALALATAGCAAAPSASGPTGISRSEPAAGNPSRVDTTSTGNPDGDTNAKAQPEPTGAAAMNKALATAEARRLLALAPLPPGAQPLITPPTSLLGPALGAPRTASLVDEAKFWHVSTPFAEVSAWVTAHPPAGLSNDGTSNGSSAAGARSAGVSYAAGDSAEWTAAKLEIDVASAAGGGSDIRVDGMAEWWDPVPLTDTEPGHRLRVDVATGCPQSDRGFVGVRNDRADLAADLAGALVPALVPAGAPAQALVCVYSGSNGDEFGLLRSVPLTGARAESLAAALASNSLRHLGDGVSSCGMDDGSVTVFALSYASGQDIDIWYSRNGCQYLANGVISAAPDGKFLGQVTTLTQWLSRSNPKPASATADIDADARDTPSGARKRTST